MEKDKQKLVVVIMGQDCEKTIGMCLESVKDADAVVYCDGGSGVDTYRIIEKKLNSFNMEEMEMRNFFVGIENKYNQEDKAMNGKQRNFYLNYLKKNFKDYWALCLDADEVVEDLDRIKKFINIAPKQDALYSVRMEHFIGDLGHVDATQPIHFVPNRLFKVREELIYPETEHPVLQSTNQVEMYNVQPTTIWHLAYIPNLWKIKERYEGHLKKSEMHTREFLDKWYKSHIFGMYPKKQIDLMSIPKVILNEFDVDKDEIYFSNRTNLEVKHFLMMKDWLDISNAKSILDIGCGFGMYGIAAKILNPKIKYTGVEISEFVNENWNYSDMELITGDIKNISVNKPFDLVLFIDILEHLTYEDLDIVLKNECKRESRFIFSIPFIGDANLDADPTHVIKESKEWWIKKLSEYFAIWEAPKEWLYSKQILIGDKK